MEILLFNLSKHLKVTQIEEHTKNLKDHLIASEWVFKTRRNFDVCCRYIIADIFIANEGRAEE